jgi:hypothetical protein
LRRIGLENEVEVAGLGEIVQPLVLQQPRNGYAGPFRFAVLVQDSSGKLQLTREVEFVGPEAQLLREEEQK